MISSVVHLLPPFTGAALVWIAVWVALMAGYVLALLVVGLSDKESHRG